MHYRSPISPGKLCLAVVSLLAATLLLAFSFIYQLQPGFTPQPPRGTVNQPSTVDSVRGGQPGSERRQPTEQSQAKLQAGQIYGQLPLSFEANVGQTNKEVKFLARGQGYGLFFTPAGPVLSFSQATDKVDVDATSFSDDRLSEIPSPTKRAVLSLKLNGARPSPQIIGSDVLSSKVNYFTGNDRSKWRTGVRTYSKVQYRGVYPGIDVVYYGNQGQLEYDFVVAPGADPERISLEFDGANAVTLDPSGDLVLQTEGGEIRQQKPIVYQDVNGERLEIDASYELRNDQVGFQIGSFDRNYPLTIDPVLIYSSYLGGSGFEQGLGIAVDAQGSAYVTGSTDSADFPLASPIQPTKSVFNDVFVLKLNPAGTVLVYSTFLGGNADDVGNDIAIDAAGNVYVVGLTGSSNFPVTPGAFQDSRDSLLDGFVFKLSSSGSSLVYSSYLGGNNSDSAVGVAVDASGRAYVVGRTDSTRFRLFIPLQRHGSTVYKSANATGDWASSSESITGSSVRGLTFDPTNSNVLYAASNYGVFKSINGGANWNLTGTVRTSTAPTVSEVVVVDPSNTSTVYAGAIGVFKSTDGGSLYDVKSSGLPGGFVWALTIDPTTPTTLFAGTTIGLYKSTNGADTWVAQNNGLGGSNRVNEIVIDPTNPAIIYLGTRFGMYKSTNGGAQWSPINNGALGGFPVPQITALAIDPLNPATLYAGTFNHPHLLFKTTDGGASWSVSEAGLPLVLGTAVNALAIDPVTPATVYAATTGGGIFKSTNSGANWTASNTGVPSTSINAVAIDRNAPSIVFAGANIGNDTFALRMNPAGSDIEYLTTLGGSENEDPRGVAIDASDNAYVVGSTASQDYPVSNAYQSVKGGLSDAFLTKLSPDGSAFVYSTYLGGSGTDQARAIAVQGSNAYVGGQTGSIELSPRESGQIVTGRLWYRRLCHEV